MKSLSVGYTIVFKIVPHYNRSALGEDGLLNVWKHGGSTLFHIRKLGEAKLSIIVYVFHNKIMVNHNQSRINLL